MKDKVYKSPNVVLNKNSSSSSVETSQGSVQSNNSNLSNDNLKKINQNNVKNLNSNPSPNVNVAMNKQPVVDSKRREADNKEIADFLKKNEKKKVPSVSKEVKRPSKNSEVDDSTIKMKYVINSNEENNSLKELMKKGRDELKKSPKDEVHWIGKDKESNINVNNFNNLGYNKKKAGNFPNVIILDKPKSSNKEIIDVISSHPSNEEINLKNPINNLKEQEELYNLNRYLNEIAKIDNEQEQTDSETNETSEINNINANNDDQFNDARDFNFIEEPSSNVTKQGSNSQLDKLYNENYETENSHIEELRIELENSLGFDLFKNVYKTVEENVKFKY
jgi:hypothetical protein